MASKEELRGKLSSAIQKDVEEAKIKKRVDDIKMTDGKFTADFCVEGLPTKKSGNKNEPMNDSSYRRYPKIFDNEDELVSYIKEFFGEDFEDYE